jgi:hypothetical protein
MSEEEIFQEKETDGPTQKEEQEEELEDLTIQLKNTWIEEVYLKVWKKREKNPLTMKELLERFVEPESPVFFLYLKF